MTDRIALTGLKIFGHHGVFDFEKRDGQDFIADITCWLDLTQAAKSDNVTDTLHYGELAEFAASVIGGAPRDLIETVAAEIADGVMERWPVIAVEVTVHKPGAPIPLAFTDVAVTMRRSVKSGRLRSTLDETREQL
ncbi:dihydroneopterin aldolase [Nakamurella antarctica]|uniref:7,8-dihydroneopterin aldolase n=1 Tax=Nakamurella antarctica TaxID=1902245 RepID=A0A3G8ZQ51_9ACTN|nr:dihydroneopterin aldolase [Nakamurella antarctica]AZI58917.1 dihydroneopterin aldolase [Nakamurella antarctica]